MKIRLGNWVGVHRTLGGLLHRIVHRRDVSEACYVCEAVWTALEAEPGFNEAMAEGLADIEAGRTRPLAEVRAELPFIRERIR